ncbi:hypothetical protein [Roseomonas sp. AR75]|uniref:hypothetical protein n=1 Tax=Roseomonas sp. AR75 TaxID=2562311 RepID=UPI0010C0B751|nr:hypothetical protein [Roseomonas sp. AR75]
MRACRQGGLAALLALLLASPAGAVELRLAAAREFSDGREGTGSGSALVPLQATLSGDGAYATLRLPAIAPGTPSAMPFDAASSRDARIDGLGDARLTLGHRLFESEDGVLLEFALRTRLPSASTPALAGGVTEHLLRLDASVPLGERATLDVSGGRRVAPLAPSALRGSDYWSLAGVLSVQLDADWSAGMMLEAQDRQTYTDAPMLDLGAFVERAVAPDLTLGLVAWHGAAGGGPAFSLGLRLAYRVSLGLDRLAR